MTDLEWMKIAFSQALIAKEYDEVPIGAVIVKDDMLISKAFNQKETLQDVSAHAEMLAIILACQKLGTWHLDGCVLYSTLEPCMMCSGAIVQSRIEKVVYGASGQRWHGISQFLDLHQFNHYPEILSGVLEEECCQILSNYFKSKR